MTKNNKQVIHHFEYIAPNYDRYKKRNDFYYTALKKAVQEHITLGDVRILDIGCGTGEIIHFLKPESGIGIDVSHTMIELANKKYQKKNNLRFFVHDIELKPYQGNFDYILFNDVIEHVVNKGKVIKHIAASMNKKTTLILTMANPWWEPILMLLEKLHLKMPEGPHSRISETDLCKLVDENELYVELRREYLLGIIYVYRIKKKIFN